MTIAWKHILKCFLLLFVLLNAADARTSFPGIFNGVKFQTGTVSVRIDTDEVQDEIQEAIKFNPSFSNKPKVIASIFGFDVPSEEPAPDFDVKVFIDTDLITEDGAKLDIRASSTVRTEARKYYISWLAYDDESAPDMIVSGSMEGRSLNNNWQLSQGSGERTYSKQYQFPFTFDNNPTVISTIAGVSVNNSIRIAATPSNVTKKGLTQQVSTFGNSVVGSASTWFVAVMNGHFGSIVDGITQIEANTLVLDSGDWGTGVFDNSGYDQTYTKKIKFKKSFNDFWAYTAVKPEVFVGISRIDMGDSNRNTFKLAVDKVNKDGFELTISAPGLATINSLSIVYLAKLEIEPVLKSYDWVFIIVCFFFFIVAFGRASYTYFREPKRIVDLEDLDMEDQYIDPDPNPKFPDPQGDEPPATEDEKKEFKQHWNLEVKKYYRARRKSTRKLQTALITRQAVFWVTGIVIFACLAILFYFTYTNKWLDSFTLESSWALFVIFIGFDYFVFMLAFTIPYPLATEGSTVHNVACFIPCHKSSRKAGHFFEFVLRLASMKFGPDAVFVCDNGNFPAPVADDFDPVTFEQTGSKVSTRDLCNHYGINYVFVPEGNKTLALYWVAKHYLPHIPGNSRFKYIFMMDDDVLIPPTLRIPDFLKEQEMREQKPNDGIVVAYAFTIQANSRACEVELMNDLHKAGDKRDFVCTPHPRSSFSSIRQPDPPLMERWLVGCQDFEYKLAGAMKIFQSAMGSTVCPHGACSLWDREKLVNDILPAHNTVFDGEDLQLGLLCRKINPRWQVKVESSVCVPTQVPIELMYKPKDSVSREKTLLQQRVNSWDVAAHRFLFTFVEHLLFYWSRKTAIVKISYVQEMLVVFQDWFRIFLLLYTIVSYQWIVIASFMVRIVALQYIIYLIFNYLKLSARKGLQKSIWIILFFPLYRLTGLVFRFIALYRNMFEVAAKKRNFFTIKERLAGQNDVPPPSHPLINVLAFVGDWSNFWVIDDSVGEPASSSSEYFQKLMAKEKARLYREEMKEKEQNDKQLQVMEGILKLMEQISGFVQNYRGTPVVQTQTVQMAPIQKYMPNTDEMDEDAVMEAEEMMEELKRLGDLIMDPNISDKERDYANYAYDQLCQRFEKTQMFKAMQKNKQQEDMAQLQADAPIDQAALQEFQELHKAGDPRILERVAKYRALDLILLPPDVIKRKHVNEFNQYSDLSNLEIRELRAIRANLPASREPRHKEYLEALTQRIKQLSEAGVSQIAKERPKIDKNARAPSVKDIGQRTVNLKEAQQKLDQLFSKAQQGKK